MSVCDDLFKKFYKIISLSDTKLNSLKIARSALRGKIKKYFNEVLKVLPPKFAGQGSFYMGLLINPIQGEYDIDDGVYLQNLSKIRSEWPTAETVHRWILTAVDGHTDKKPVDKDTCVRVLYSDNAGYHVDLPIYGIERNVAYLAKKNENPWPESDPKAMKDWFDKNISLHGEQLRRVICYFKAWGDYKKGAMLNGLAFTISCCNSFQKSTGDDVALVETAKQMLFNLKLERQVIKPVTPHDNLLENWTEQQIDDFLDELSDLVEKGGSAVNSNDKEFSSEVWQEIFGSRFPLSQNDNSNRVPLVVTTRKPWCKD